MTWRADGRRGRGRRWESRLSSSRRWVSGDAPPRPLEAAHADRERSGGGGTGDPSEHDLRTRPASTWRTPLRLLPR